MDVLSVSPIRTASLIWQPRRDSFVLTVVCKATYVLAPVTSELAPEQEYPNEDENHWNDDPARSVYSPSDLVPFKPRAEVMLVGHAFASPGERARSVVARVVVGEVDKAVEVFADRTFALDGTLREGPPFSRVPLRYERAAGGPDSANPVGVRPDARDTRGALALPSLQPTGLLVTSPADFIAAVGFGPIAAGWSSRQEKLGPLSGRWSERSLAGEPLPIEVDPGYFMAAPRDQQLAAIRPDERIVLEHLHVDHARLVTSLPGIEPRAFVERPGAPAAELPLVADTLWIDTDRSLCTLTWRGQLTVEHPAAEGRVLVGAAKVGWPLTWAEVEAEWRRTRADGRQPSPSMHPAELMEDEEGDTPAPPQTHGAQRRASSSALPFVEPLPAAKGDPRSAPAPARAPRVRAITMPLGETLDTVLPNDVVERAMAAAAADRAQGAGDAVSGDASPAWLRGPRPPVAGQAPPPPPKQRTAPPPPQVPAPPPIRFGAPPPPPPPSDPGAAIRFGPPPEPVPVPVPPPAPAWRASAPDLLPSLVSSPNLAQPTVGQQVARTASPNEAPRPALPAPPAPRPPAKGDAAGSLPRSPSTPDTGRSLIPGEAAKLGAAAASDAAAAKEAPSGTNGAGATDASRAPQPPARPRDVLDLLWFDPALAARLRTLAPYRDLIAPRVASEAWITAELPPRDKNAEQVERDRRDVLRVIGRAEPFDASRIDRAIEDACDDEGAFSPPVAIIAGDLTFRFDEREALKATVTSVAPLIGADKKLREIVSEATDALKGEWPLPDDVADGFTRRVEQAFASSARAVPQGYLQSSVDKLLLEGRHYRKKSVFSEPRIRAELAGAGSDPIPTYLPVSLAMRLPLFSRFRSVMIVELRTQEDQHETHPQALLVLAVARVLDRRRSP